MRVEMRVYMRVDMRVQRGLDLDGCYEATVIWVLKCCSSSKKKSSALSEMQKQWQLA